MLCATKRDAPAAFAAASRLRVALTPHARVRVVGRRLLIGQIGQLVHHRLGPKGAHRLAERVRIERVADNRLGP